MTARRSTQPGVAVAAGRELVQQAYNDGAAHPRMIQSCR